MAKEGLQSGSVQAGRQIRVQLGSVVGTWRFLFMGLSPCSWHLKAGAGGEEGKARKGAASSSSKGQGLKGPWHGCRGSHQSPPLPGILVLDL